MMLGLAGLLIAAAGPQVEVDTDRTMGRIARAGLDEVHRLKVPGSPPTATARSSDGRHRASIGPMGDLILRSAEGLPLWSRDVPAPAGGLSFSPDDRWLACSAADRLLILEAHSGQCVHERPAVRSRLSWRADGPLLACFTDDATLSVIDCNDWSEAARLHVPDAVRRGRGSGGYPTMPVGFGPDGESIAIGSSRSALIWSLAGGPAREGPASWLPETLPHAGVANAAHRDHAAFVDALRFCGRGDHLFLEAAGDIHLLELATGKLSLAAKDCSLLGTAQGDAVMVRGPTPTVELLHCETRGRRWLLDLPRSRSGRYPRRLLAPDGGLLVASSRGEDAIVLCDPRSGAEQLPIPGRLGWNQHVHEMAWDPRERWLALAVEVGGTEGGVLVLDRAGKQVFRSSAATAAWTVDFNHDGALLAWADAERVHLVRTVDFQEVAAVKAEVLWWRFLDPELTVSHDGERLTFWHGPSLRPVHDMSLQIEGQALSSKRTHLAFVTGRGVVVYRVRG